MQNICNHCLRPIDEPGKHVICPKCAQLGKLLKDTDQFTLVRLIEAYRLDIEVTRVSIEQGTMHRES